MALQPVCIFSLGLSALCLLGLTLAEVPGLTLAEVPGSRVQGGMGLALGVLGVPTVCRDFLG